jgi:4-hydroxymandelate oxidase
VLPLLARQLAEAQDRLPQAVFDYYAGGAGEEISLDEAESAWQRYRLLPHVLRDVAAVDTGCELLGHRYATPFGIAPMATQQLLHPDGELATARASAAAGGPFVLSTRSSHTLEDVGAAVGGPWWFQVYVTRDRSITEGLVGRALAAGATALVLTGDTPFLGRRKRAGRPAALSADASMINIARHIRPGADPDIAAEQDPSITPDTISWLAGISGVPVLVKGVLRGDDARACVDAGAAGVIVSNHGGRQLDRAVPSAAALPHVISALADRNAEVLVDGGIRSGVDALVALAMGARGVLLGRPFAWGLLAGGQDGVAATFAALADDLRLAAALVGARSLAALDPTLVAPSR